MNLPPDRPKLRLAKTGIVALLFLSPTWLYLYFIGGGVALSASRDKEVVFYNYLSFGMLELFTFLAFIFVVILIWRPESPAGPKLVK